ncbi:protein phosphatase 2C domain-containing protein [Streptomyces sp. NBC_01498]|uniref:protein phosphatase 2C domain-containing protein n=1 Tax=Streptomyces sp. NBC_01498 TaxID=2975870 RepID=UPI002E7AD7D6|nr:protein phosphatase 2C domain-containing protein [Streptomyces sp. NBC_01498]WTL24670.1 protein phosphatase 2C domain-containing protein [Streptomyces sp. NBC_01498]
MRIDIATAPGSHPRPNEDWTAVAAPSAGSGGTLIALDGVTPPPDGDGCAHGVPWFTARLGGALTELSASRRELSLADALAESIRRTADAHRDTCDLSHPRTPQATVVMVRWDADTVEHLVLSDSTLLLESPDGEVRAVVDDRLDRVPREVRRRAAATDALRNAKGGFFTAAVDPGVAAKAVTGRTPAADVRAVVALTDGAARWVEVFREGDWADCLALVRKSGPQELIDRVRAAESADPDGAAFRRGKPYDDATVVYVEP